MRAICNAHAMYNSTGLAKLEATALAFVPPDLSHETGCIGGLLAAIPMHPTVRTALLQTAYQKLRALRGGLGGNVPCEGAHLDGRVAVRGRRRRF